MFQLTRYMALLLLFAMGACSKDKKINQEGKLVPKTVMEDPSLPATEVNGVRLHAQAFGPADSTLIVCIHGGPGANFRYLLNCKSLANKGYRVVFYDQRGSGLSQRFHKDWYLRDGEDAINKHYYEDLKAIIQRYKTKASQKVVLLTQSWGSMLATGYTGKYPTEIEGLILAEPGGLKWEDILTYVRASRSFALWSEAFNDASYIDQFIAGHEDQHALLDYKTMLLSASNSNVGDVSSRLGSNAISYTSSRYGAVINAAMFKIGEMYKPDFSTGINQFEPKVLFFYSSNNKAYPDHWAEKIASAYKHKELCKVPGVGHSGMFDQIDTWTHFTEPKILDYLKHL